MEAFEKIREIIMEILDVEKEEISPETNVMKDLGAESIDLLELGVALNAEFNKEVRDDEIFLTKLRAHVDMAGELGMKKDEILKEKYPSLGRERIEEILAEMENGPVLKVKDLAAYVERA